MTVEIITELDRLVQLFESSILTFLRVEVTFIPDARLRGM